MYLKKCMKISNLKKNLISVKTSHQQNFLSSVWLSSTDSEIEFYCPGWALDRNRRRIRTLGILLSFRSIHSLPWHCHTDRCIVPSLEYPQINNMWKEHRRFPSTSQNLASSIHVYAIVSFRTYRSLSMMIIHVYL